jgi:hypothetical protein
MFMISYILYSYELSYVLYFLYSQVGGSYKKYY